jgi:hypothetical protein
MVEAPVVELAPLHMALTHSMRWQETTADGGGSAMKVEARGEDTGTGTYFAWERAHSSRQWHRFLFHLKI